MFFSWTCHDMSKTQASQRNAAVHDSVYIQASKKLRIITIKIIPIIITAVMRDDHTVIISC